MAALWSRRGWVVALLGALSLGISACSGGGSDVSPSQSLDNALNAALHDQLQGNLGAAKSGYNQVLKADPTNLYAHYNLGLIAQTQHQSAAAEAQYRLALQSSENFEPALFNLAILLTPSSPTQAIAVYEHAISVDPNNANAHFNLGLLLIQTGQKNAGEAQLSEAIKLDPTLAKRIPSSASSGAAAPSAGPSSSTRTTS